MNNKELHDILQKYVKDKVCNVTDEEMSRKLLSGFPHTEKWRSLKPDVSSGIEPDADLILGSNGP